MAAEFLKPPGRILVVQGPKSLPSEVDHATAISALCREAALVILFSFGDDKYRLPPSFTLPVNAKVIEYDYETLNESVDAISDALAHVGAQFLSRHKGQERLPFVLTGGVVVLPPGAELEVYTSQSDSTQYSVTGTDVDESYSTWSV